MCSPPPRVFALSRLLRVGGAGAGGATPGGAARGAGEAGRESFSPPRSSLCVSPDDDGVLSHTSSSAGDLVVLLPRKSNRIVTLSLNRRRAAATKNGKKKNVDENQEDEGEVVPDVRSVPWFDSPELRPRCAALSPGEDFLAVVAARGDVFVAPTQLLSPGFRARDKDCNFRSWSDHSLTALPSKDVPNRIAAMSAVAAANQQQQQQQQQQPSSTTMLSSSSVSSKSAPRAPAAVEPTAALWWTSQDFVSVCYVGTSSGDIVCVDLVTGAELGLVSVFSSPGDAVSGLDTVTDAALDCTHLIATSSSSQQARILIEQRSTGVSWPVPGSNRSGGGGLSVGGGGHRRTPSASSSGDQQSKSRLSGLKQMSVAGFANLRQRISEGRKMLSSSTASNEARKTSPTVEMGQDALEAVVNNGSCNGGGGGAPSPSLSASAAACLACYEDPAMVGVEPLSAKVGDTRVSVQRSGGCGGDGGGGEPPLLAGVFPETAILTMHNSEMEVLPQSAYKLPRGTERVLLLGDKVMLVATSSRSDTSARSRRGHLHLVSALHAELHLESGVKSESSVLQSFSLGPQESVIALVKCRSRPPPPSNQSATATKDDSRKSSTGDSPVPSSSQAASSLATSSSASSSSAAAADDAEKSAASITARGALNDCSLAFTNGIERRTEEVRRLSRSSARRLECLVVTSEAVYLLEPSSDPAGTFLSLAMRGGTGDLDSAGRVAVAFALDARSLFEHAADLRLCQKDFASAIALYRQAGCKHLRVVLKFASSGCIAQLLSYLMVLFKTPNLEVTPAERIHLSNLALMAYFQQALTKTTPVLRAKFSSQIRSFLDDNRSFDECLAVRLAAETREWECLSHLAGARGLAGEMAEAVGAVAAGKETDGSALPSSAEVSREVAGTLREMSGAEREGMLACLLQEGTVEAVVVSSYSQQQKDGGGKGLRTALRHLGVVSATLSLLEEPGLLSVLRQCGPTNRGLRCSYLRLLESGGGGKSWDRKKLQHRGRGRGRGGDNDEDEGDSLDEEEEEELRAMEVPRALLNLTVSAVLALLKKRKAAAAATMTKNGNNATSELLQQQQKTVCDIVPKRYATKSEKNSRDEPPQVRQVRLSAGAGHVLYTYRGGSELVTWGASAGGVLGKGATATRFCGAQRVSVSPRCPIFGGGGGGGVRVRSVACGKAHSLALTDAGLFAWGSSAFGQLGLGRTRRAEQRPSAVAFPGDGSPLVSLSAGQYHSAAVDSAGRVWTWGWGVHGQLGSGDVEDVFQPTQVFGGKRRASMVSCGYAHTLVLTEASGKVWSFGCGLFGQLGLGHTKKSARPTRVLFPDKSERFRLVECGYFHNVAVAAESGRLFTWGCNPQVLRLEAQQKKRIRLASQVGGGAAGARRIAEVAARRGLAVTGGGGAAEDKSPSSSSSIASAGSLLKDIKRQAKQALDDIRSFDGTGKPGDNSDSDSPEVSGDAELKTEAGGMPPPEEKSGEEPVAKKEEEEEETPAHLLPTEMEAGPALLGGSPVSAVSCGNQHSLLLTASGAVFSVGRNLDGQLGTGSRKESRLPAQVSALSAEGSRILAVSCGGDYSLAASASGAVFAWGNNSSGQLGRSPITDESGATADGGAKVVVMKTTRRIIRLQNSLQNSCDVPRPVPGVPVSSGSSNRSGSGSSAEREESVYAGRADFRSSDEDEDGDEVVEWSGEAGEAVSRNEKLFADFADADSSSTEWADRLLHLTLETFAADVLASDRDQCRRMTKQCLVTDNLKAAAKVNLLAGNLTQAFDLSLQLIVKTAASAPSPNATSHKGVGEQIFAAFLFYLKESSSSPVHEDDEEAASAARQRTRRQLLERLVSCWQDQGFSFVQLESFFLGSLSGEPQLLQTLVLTLFKPEEESAADGEDGLEDEVPDFRAASPLSVGSSSSAGPPGPRLVDLFTPEFCLRIGDTSVREMGQEASRWMSKGGKNKGKNCKEEQEAKNG